MEEYANGFEFLESLKRQSGKQAPDYTLLSKYIAFKARKRGVPICGQFELTPLCNFNCGMCYVHLTPEQLHERDVLSVNEWKKLLTARNIVEHPEYVESSAYRIIIEKWPETQAISVLLL